MGVFGRGNVGGLDEVETGSIAFLGNGHGNACRSSELLCPNDTARRKAGSAAIDADTATAAQGVGNWRLERVFFAVLHDCRPDPQRSMRVWW